MNVQDSRQTELSRALFVFFPLRDRFPQQVLDLTIYTAQFVRGPFLEIVP